MNEEHEKRRYDTRGRPAPFMYGGGSGGPPGTPPKRKESSIELLWILLVLLIATRVLGEAAVRAGQPALVGELAGGIAVGVIAREWSGAFPVLADLGHNEVFLGITELGVFFLMLHAGAEMRVSRLVRSSGGSFLVAAGGMVVPFASGYVLAELALPDSPQKMAQSIFLGTALAVTAVPVAIKVLLDLDFLETRVGRTIVSAAIIDDVLSLVLLALLTALLRTGELPPLADLLILVGQILVFFGVSAVAGKWVFPRVTAWAARARSAELELSGLLVFGLALALLAEKLGMHFIIGAFVAGLFFSRSLVDDDLYEAVLTRLSGVTTGFLAPIFFASVGLHLELSAVTAVPVFLTALVLIAAVGKLVGAGLSARVVGLSGAGAAAVGIAMSARGAVELIVADVAMQAGLFAAPDHPIVENMFSTVVIMAIATTVLAPVALRPLLSRTESGRGDREKGDGASGSETSD